MDLVSALSGISQGQSLDAVNISVAAKSLDIMRSQGAGVVKMIQSAGQAGVQPGDEMVARATGMGGQLDTYA
jgi:hypothetical protein